MNQPKILIVDDEKDIIELLKYNLEKAEFRTISAGNGSDALEIIEKSNPDLIILDLMMPEINGIEVCRILKKNDETKNIPIIMLTARATEMDKIIGLDLGADDYVTKPFSPREIIYRINAVLRRTKKEKPINERIIIKDFVMDFAKHEVSIKNKQIDLTFQEFELLKALVTSRNRVLTRDHLLNTAWGYDYAGETRTVDVHVRRLREKLKPIASHIITVKNVGYKFI
jgi:two-component system alkaline phosphatase synthesis response regulator PhoP